MAETTPTIERPTVPAQEKGPAAATAASKDVLTGMQTSEGRSWFEKNMPYLAGALKKLTGLFR
jgi:hypothetical protein